MESSTFRKIRIISPSAVCFGLILSCCTGGPQTSLEQQPASSPTPGTGSTLITEKDSMVMLYIPGGTFQMGSTGIRLDEEPIHAVTLSPYWIDSTEVTNAMYMQCVEEGKCSPPDSSESHTRSSYYGNTAFDNYPVVYVSWRDAQNYCEWAGKQLPTEAQWEFAARGTDGRIYPWGNTSPTCDDANYWLNDSSNGCVGDTAEVGSYDSGKSPFGVYDMAGNVWEWVYEYYGSYASKSQTDPQGPTTGNYRVLRGGSWYGCEIFLRSSDRDWFEPELTYGFIGFRCSISLP